MKTCPICGAKLAYYAEKEHMNLHPWVEELREIKDAQEQRRRKIQKNLEIINSTKGTNHGIAKWRRLYAIYRLYCHLNMPLKEISEISGISIYSVKQDVGVVFKRLCLKNQCVAASYFELEEKTK